MIHTLPPLPYAADALEPKMSQETIGYHYGKHAKAYVDKLNSLIKDTPYESMSLEDIIVKADGAIFNNAAEVWNHVFFFNTLTPEPVKMPEDLEQAIANDFGSAENFKEEMKIATLSLFGSGWVWLAEDQEGRLHITSESNAGNPLTKGYIPLLTFDVWEQAYYIDYRNQRADHLMHIWGIIDWKLIEQRYVNRLNK